MQKFYILLFILRRIAVILICLYFTLQGMQLLSLMFLNFFHFSFVGNIEPFTTHRKNLVNALNESVILNMTVLMVMFTDFVPDYTTRYNWSWIFIGELMLFIFISFWYSLYPGLRLFYYVLVRWYRILKRKFRQTFPKLYEKFCLTKKDKQYLDIDKEEQPVVDILNVVKKTERTDQETFEDFIKLQEEELKQMHYTVFN